MLHCLLAVPKMSADIQDPNAMEIEWGEGGRVKKGEGPRENWEKVQVLWICRGVGVVPSRVIRDEYRM